MRTDGFVLYEFQAVERTQRQGAGRSTHWARTKVRVRKRQLARNAANECAQKDGHCLCPTDVHNKKTRKKLCAARCIL